MRTSGGFSRAARRRLGAAMAAGALVAAAAPLARRAYAAGDEVQYRGAWKVRVKGPGAASDPTDAGGQTTLQLDAGYASKSGARRSTITATRKVRLVDGDGGGVGVTLYAESALYFEDGQATVDVSLRRGKSAAMLLPVFRDTSAYPTNDYTFYWSRSSPLPAGDYTIVVRIDYRRSKSGTIGESAPHEPRHLVRFGPTTM